MDQTMLHELATRVRTLETKLAIHELLARYGCVLDEWDWDGIRAIIHPQIVTRHDAVAPPMQGIDTFIKVLESIRPKLTAAQHFITNTQVEVHPGGDSATARAFVFAMHDTGVMKGGKLLQAGGAYRMQIVRADTPGGWQIREIEVLETWLDPRLLTEVYDTSPMAQASHSGA